MQAEGSRGQQRMHAPDKYETMTKHVLAVDMQLKKSQKQGASVAFPIN